MIHISSGLCKVFNRLLLASPKGLQLLYRLQPLLKGLRLSPPASAEKAAAEAFLQNPLVILPGLSYAN
jgi:hypothetical protein